MLNTSALYKQAIIASTRSTVSSVFFGLYDVTAKDDASPSAINGQPFVSVQGTVDNVRTPPVNIATLEEDYFKMDGSFLTTPSNLSPLYNLGWWSLYQSGIDRKFGLNPIVTINFATLHTSLGAELFFDSLGGSYCESFKITWLRNSTVILEALVEGNTEKRRYVDLPVENYNKVIIELIRTDKPFRYARLMEVNFGGEKIFNNDNIISASIVEEVDPNCITLSMNRLKITVVNTDQEFNMINPQGVYKLLQKRQQIVASTGLVLPDGSTTVIPLGTFYLSDWKNSTGMTATLEATDVMGLLDRTTYYTSPFWVNAPIATVINHILGDAGNYPYVISSEVATEVVNGYIPIVSHRVALQLILMASRATIRDDRGGILNIFRVNYSSISKNLDNSILIGQPQISQKTLVTSAVVKEYSYTLGAAAEELSKSTFSFVGTETVIIPYGKAPATNVAVAIAGSGVVVGTPTLSATAAILTVAGSGSMTITVSGKVYSETTKLITARVLSLSAGEVHQTATIGDNKLICGIGKAQAVSQHILDYYGKRIKQTFDYWDDPSIQAGDCIGVETMFGQTQNGVIQRQEIQFSPSLKAKLEVIG